MHCLREMGRGMRGRGGVWAACVMAAAVTGFAEESSNAAAWIEQLRNDEFEVREKAKSKLAELGEAARPELERAACGDDPGLRDAARTLLAKLEKAALIIWAFDRDGKPARGAQAEVFIRGSGKGGNGQDSQPITIDAAGRAVLPLDFAGPANLRINWKDWVCAGPNWTNLKILTGNNPFLTALTRYGQVSVTVRDAAEKAIPDASVMLLPPMDPQVLELQLEADQIRMNEQGLKQGSGEDGRALLEDVPPGVYQPVVKCEGYLPAVLPLIRVSEGARTEAPPVKLKTRGKTSLVLALQNADGTPIKNAMFLPLAEPVLAEADAAKDAVRQRMFSLKAMMSGQRANAVRSDENGKLPAIENLAPGRYRVSVRNADCIECHFGEVELKAGQPGELVCKYGAGGPIRGRMVEPFEKSASYLSLGLILESDILELMDKPQAGDMWTWRSYGLRYTGQNGKFEFKNVPAGKYALLATPNNGRGLQFLIPGVEVKDAEGASLGDIVLPGRKTVQNSAKGRVLLPDGQPAARMTVALLGARTTSATMTNERGEFDLANVNIGEEIIRLAVVTAGYRPCVVDLSDKTQSTAALTLRLQKQDFGTLKVRVVDEAGRPLRNAVVSVPRSGQIVNYYRVRAQESRTRENGEARLDEKLAVGERTVAAELDGYSMTQAVKVMIEAGKETVATVKMRRGFTVRGKVELPDGVKPENVFVSSSSSGLYSQSQPVSAGGSFSLEGLELGSYAVTGSGPGLICAAPAQFTLKAEDAAAPGPVTVKLCRPAGVAVKVDPVFAGASASLVPEDEVLNGLMKENTVAAGVVDAAGRIEFWGMPAGKYKVLLDELPGGLYGNITQGRIASMRLIAGPVEARVLSSCAELASLPPVEAAVARGTGSVRLQVQPFVPGGNTADAVNFEVVLTGSKAVVVMPQSHGGPKPIVVIGALPAGVNVPGARTLCFQTLPPGEYTLSVRPAVSYMRDFRVRTMVNGGGGGMFIFAASPSQPAKTAVEVMKCTVKAGEEVNLGQVKVELPKEMFFTPQMSVNRNIEAIDMLPGFQP